MKKARQIAEIYIYNREKERVNESEKERDNTTIVINREGI